MFLITGSEGLKGFVDEYRGDPYSNWEPMNIFHDIEYDLDSCEIEGKIAYLKSIVIGEEYRNNGIGTAVINEIIDHLKGIGFNYFILQPSSIMDSISSAQNEENELHK